MPSYASLVSCLADAHQPYHAWYWSIGQDYEWDWTIPVEIRRHAELSRVLRGITPKTLTQQLRELDQDGLITRTVYPEGRSNSLHVDREGRRP